VRLEILREMAVFNGQIAQFRSRSRGMVVLCFLPLRKEIRLLLHGLSVRNCRDRINPAGCANRGKNVEFPKICVFSSVAERPPLLSYTVGAAE
jgi:hypothetical protein